MRRTRLYIGILLCSLLLLTGCDLEFVSPDSLITAPASNQERLQQKQQITAFLSREESLIVPEDLNSTDAYQYVDIDQDGEEEIVAFYANKESNFMLGFIVLDQTGDNWHLRHKAVAYGTDIHYFAVEDLDRDGRMELLLGVQSGYGSLKELYLYHLADDALVDVAEEERITYDQITLAQNDDGHSVIVTARTDTTVLAGSSNITVYQYNNQNVSPVYNETFDGYCSEMQTGRVSPGQTGVYLAMRHNYFVNILLLKETEESYAVLMEHPLPYEYDDASQVQLFRDINEDGILEINSLWVPENNNTAKTSQEYIQVWLQWDSVDSVRAVESVLESYSDGYRFQVPIQWMDSLYYEFREEESVSWVDFYYENDQMEFETVFSFAAMDQYIWETQKQDDFLVLGNNPGKNKIYVAELHRESFNGFSVDASRLISCLQIEGGERK